MVLRRCPPLWKDKNSKSEYYNHCDVMIASEPSLLKVIKLLQQPMMESLRIVVSMDYAVLKTKSRSLSCGASKEYCQAYAESTKTVTISRTATSVFGRWITSSLRSVPNWKNTIST